MSITIPETGNQPEVNGYNKGPDSLVRIALASNHIYQQNVPEQEAVFD